MVKEPFLWAGNIVSVGQKMVFSVVSGRTFRLVEPIRSSGRLQLPVH